MTANDWWYHDPARGPNGVLGHIYDDGFLDKLADKKFRFHRKKVKKPQKLRKPGVPRSEARQICNLLQALQSTSFRQDPLWKDLKIG